MDDALLLTANPIIAAPNGLARIWFTTEPSDYWPVTNTSFWIEWRLWGTDPRGYHATNVLLHAVNACLLMLVLRRLRVPGALLAALLFAIHPVGVQTVAWIAQRKNLLAMFFFLLSVHFFVRAVEERSTTPTKARWGIRNRWYWSSLTAFLLAMLSKGSVAMAPVVLLGLLWWKGRREVGWLRRGVALVAPFVLVAVLLTAVNIWFQTHGTGQTIRNVTVAQRVAGAGAVVWFYLWKALLPIKLVFIYPQWQIDVKSLAWWLPSTATLTVTAALIWTTRRDWRWSEPLLVAWVFFIVLLVPVMGLVDVGFMQFALVADAYEYFALIGVVALAAAAWTAWYQRSVRKTLSVACVGLALMALGWTTFGQASLYRNSVSLYRAGVARFPDDWYAHYSLAKALGDVGKKAEALDELRATVQLNPADARSRYDLGAALIERHEDADAAAHLTRSVELDPSWAEAHNNLGIALLRLGREKQAYEQFEMARRLKPDFADAYANLAGVLLQRGDVQRCVELARRAVALDRNDPIAQNNLALGLTRLGEPEEALEHFDAAVHAKADYFEAHLNMGAVLGELGYTDQAILKFQDALRVQPGSLVATVNLSAAYASAGRLREAIDTGEQAVAIAKSSGQVEFAGQLEARLVGYRAQLAKKK